MKKTIVIAAVLLAMCLLFLAGCGEEEAAVEEPETCEIVLITDQTSVEDGTFNKAAWDAITAFGEENEMTCQTFRTEDGSEEECLELIEEAKNKGGRIIFLAGSQFETAAYKAQQKYKDIYFILLDAVPRDDEYNYETAANSAGVLFAEEQAGYLAGYSAVMDGYKKIAFLGGAALPSVKRYGYGFVQGASAAVKERGSGKVDIKYSYSGTFTASYSILETATEWYNDGTEVIFACGGSIGEAVARAADKEDGKMIGVDSDQSVLSENVITSAKKDIGKAVTDILKSYKRNNFQGGAIFNYSAENDGVSLEMDNARFVQFDREMYKKLMDDMKEGQIAIKKDIGTDSVKTLAGDGVNVEVIGSEDGPAQQDPRDAAEESGEDDEEDGDAADGGEDDNDGEDG